MLTEKKPAVSEDTNLPGQTLNATCKKAALEASGNTKHAKVTPLMCLYTPSPVKSDFHPCM